LPKPNVLSFQASELEMVKQLQGDVLPIQRMTMPIKARQITDEERDVSVFKSMRMARANKRLLGIREKRAKDKAEEAALKKK
jgi:large subunit ribosomal protein L13e